MRSWTRRWLLGLVLYFAGLGLHRGLQVEALHREQDPSRLLSRDQTWRARITRHQHGLRLKGGISEDDNFPSDSVGRFSSSTAEHQAGRVEQHCDENIPRVYRAKWSSTWSQLVYRFSSVSIAIISLAVVWNKSVKYPFFEPYVQPTSLISISIFVSFFRKAASWLIRALVFRRIAHFVLAFFILPGPWLMGESSLEAVHLKGSTMRKFKDDIRQRCKIGRTIMEQDLNGVDIKIITADGEPLDAMFFRSKNNTLGGPTMVRFNGNAEAFEMLDNSLIRLYLRAGCNVMLCNYRGVNPTRRSRKFDASYSTSRDLKLKEDSSILQKTVGKFVRKLERLVNWCVVTERDSMILDAEAVLQYLIRVHQVRRSRLLVFGHSIGGAVAAILSDKYQTPTCNSRSFARLSKIVAIHGSMVLSQIFPFLPLLPFKFVFRALCWLLCKVSGWEMEVARRWPRICRSKWTEYCVGDKIIPYTCSLHHAVHKMKGDVPASGSKGSSLSLEVLDADNHNRIYTKTELAKHVSLMRRALRLSARA